MYPITDPDDVVRAAEKIKGYTRDSDGNYHRNELRYAANTATVTRHTSDGPVPDHSQRQAELDKRDHAIMDAVPEKLTGWATSPLPEHVRWHAEWIAARQKYVRSGDPGDLDRMRSFVTFESPPLLADVQLAQPAPAPARPRNARLITAMTAVTLLVAAYLGVGWSTDPTPQAIPFTCFVTAIVCAMWVCYRFRKRT